MNHNETVVQAYQAPVERIEAIRFQGYRNADTIRKWATDVFYVPRGYDFPTQRHPREYDRSNGHLLEDAPEILVIKGYGGDQRADVGDWIVRLVGDDGNGNEETEFRVLSDEEFNAAYSQPDTTKVKKALDELFAHTAESHEPKDFYPNYNILAEALGLKKK